jgi:hypothetical protein
MNMHCCGREGRGGEEERGVNSHRIIIIIFAISPTGDKRQSVRLFRP